MTFCRAGRTLVLVLAILPVACDQPQMAEQPKYKPYEAAPDLPGGMAAMHAPAGTVSRDAPLGPRAKRPTTTMALMRRGQSLFNGICAPCHSRLGDGDGIVVHRGFPPPPSFHQDRLRTASGTHFYDVITHGHGLMYSYANRVAPEDRWAIVAYIRALQRSQRSRVADLPAALRRKLSTGTEPKP